MSETDFIDANREHWDDRAEAHSVHGTGYRVERYVADRTLLSDVVRFDVERLGDIAGLRTVHLQCHIGTDTLSLARLGARVTGLDFSASAAQAGRDLVAQTGDDVDFVVSNVYDAADALGGERFDLVFTGIGALCWLPDIDRWAATVASLLKPGGRLHLREIHPIVWSVDERIPDGPHLRFPYFQQTEPVLWDDDTTYVEVDKPILATKSYEWNRSLGEIVTALLAHGMRLTMLVEHDSIPYEPMPGLMVDGGDGEWRMKHQPSALPLTYTLQAVKE